MKKIGQYLKEIADVPDQAIEAALARQAASGKCLGEILVADGVVDAQALSFALMRQRLDVVGRTGFLAALQVVRASLQISRRDLRGLWVLVGLGLLGGAVSFPILFYFYSTWAWTVIGATLEPGDVVRVGAATAALVLLSNAIDYVISTATSRTIAWHAADLFRALHHRAVASAGGADEASQRRTLAGGAGHTVEQYAAAMTTLFMAGPRSLGTVVAGTMPILLGDVGVALAAMAVAVPATLLPVYISARANPHIRGESAAIGDAMALLDPYFRHARTAAAFPLETRERIAHAALRSTHEAQLRKYTVWALSGTVRGLLETLIPLAVAACGGYLAITGAMPASSVFGILVTVVLIVPRLRGLYDTYLAALTASQHAIQLASFRFRPRGPADPTVAAPAVTAGPPGVDFVLEVHVDAGDDRPEVRRLQGRDFTFRSGECVFVVGESGAGKTTLARVVAGFATTASTTSRLAPGTGAPARAVEPGEVAFIGSEPFFFEGVSTLRNLLLHDDVDPGQELAATGQLQALGMDWTLRDGQSFGKLSVGERQRLHLVRGLCARQRIRVFDEPTSALDRANAAVAQRLLERVRGDQLHIVITHDREWAARSGCRVITIAS